MPLLKISKAQLLRGTITSPGWYDFKVANAEVKKDDKTGKTHLTYLLVNLKTEKEHEQKFNIEWLGFAEPFLSAIEGKKIETDKDYDFDPTTHIGKTLQIKVETEISETNKQPYDKLAMFLPTGAQVPF